MRIDQSSVERVDEELTRSDFTSEVTRTRNDDTPPQSTETTQARDSSGRGAASSDERLSLASARALSQNTLALKQLTAYLPGFELVRTCFVLFSYLSFASFYFRVPIVKHYSSSVG